MSSGVAVDFSALSRAGTSLAAGLEDGRKQNLLQALGGQVQAGDYAGAAKTAFDAGDLQTGLALVKLGDSKAQTADFQKNFGGGFGAMFGGGDAQTGTPSTVQPLAAGAAKADRELAAFKTSDPVAPGLQPQQKALLNAIAGGESGGKYNVRYTPRGGALFDLNGQHPGVAEAGPAGPSTAAGRYQFTKTTWDRLGGGDFSPENQDRRALQLAEQDYRSRTGRDLNADLSAEGFSPRIQKALAPTWAALGGNTGRHTATFAESLQRYGANGEPAQQAAAPQRVQVASADPSFVPQQPSAAAGASPAAPSMTLPGADAAPSGPTMTLPAEADPVAPEVRQQVAQAAPQVLVQAGMKPAAAATFNGMQPGSAQRINWLVRAMSHPAAPEGAKEGMKALLANELQMDRENRQMTPDQKEFAWRTANGYRGTVEDMVAEKRKGADPAIIQEYEYAKKNNGYTGSLLDYTKSKAEAGSTKISNTVNAQGAEGEQDKVVQKDFGDLQIEQRKAAGQAATSLANIRAARQIMQDPTFYSGTFGSLATEGKKALASIGLAAPDSARANEGFTKISAQSILDKAGGSFGNAFSNGDREAIKQTAQNIDNTPAGNALILDMSERVAMRAQENHRQMIAYKAAHKGRIDDGFLAQIDKYSQDNPLFAGLDIPGPGVKAAPARPAGTPAPGQRDASVQQAPKLNPAPASEVSLARAAIAAGVPQAKVLEKMRARGFDPSGL